MATRSGSAARPAGALAALAAALLAGLLAGSASALAWSPVRLLAELDELSAAVPAAADHPRRRDPSLSANPAATNQSPGVGLAGRLLGLDELGLRLGGLWFVDLSGGLVGGLESGTWLGENLLVLDATIDLERLVRWPGASVGAEFLNHGGSPGSKLTGDVQGFEGLDDGPPFNRTELYELWFRQTLFDGRFALRLGKQIPSYDFAVVADVTPLLMTPIFSMPTVIGKMPGYPDSAAGVSAFVYPTDHTYVGYGFYDGRLGADGTPTGITGPAFSGKYFMIAEGGATWALGGGHLPGAVGFGGFLQTGTLKRFDGGTQNGTTGAYGFVKQRLWTDSNAPGQGISSWLAVGFADPNVQLAQAYVGGGLAWTGLVPGRDADSVAAGFAWSDLTDSPGAEATAFPQYTSGKLRPSELILQTTYQLVVTRNLFLQPALSWIPHPGQNSGITNALALTLRLGLLF